MGEGLCEVDANWWWTRWLGGVGEGTVRPFLSRGDACWPTAAPGGRSPVAGERESEVERRESEREIAWVRERVRDVGVLYPT